MKKISIYLFFIINAMNLFASSPILFEKEKAQQLLKNKPVRFLENKGQMTDMAYKPVPFVLFKAEAPGMNMYITEKGITYVFIKAEEEENEEKEKKGEHHEEKIEVEWNRVDMNLKGASIKKENIIKEGQSTDFKQYFLGHCPNGITDVRSYEKITIKEIYPGIDWVLYNSNNKGFKYDFIVHPGANATDIAIVYNSQKPIKLNTKGELEITTKLGSLTENKPYSYIQETNTEIKSEFNISEKRIERNHYETVVNIELSGNENLVNQTIVIDPQLLWATLLGGSLYEGAMSMTTDASENLFLCGYSASLNFPTVNSGSFFQGTLSGTGQAIDVVILKFNSAGVLIWSTYYGGSINNPGGIDEIAQSIVADPLGNIYIVGGTPSTNFPVLNNGGFFQATNGGGNDGFILKFDNAGNRLWATYYGGNGGDELHSVKLDPFGNIFACGEIPSTNATVLNPGGGAYFQATSGGANEAMILKFNATSALVWATYYGGSGNEIACDLAIDLAGNLYVAGSTSSSNFPTKNAGTYFQGTYNGGSNDAFIVKFDNLGSQVWATYYGGSGFDKAYSIGVDKNGNVFGMGFTESTNMPTRNAGTYFQGTYNGGTFDIFIFKFNNQGNHLWGTYFGGNYQEFVYTTYNNLVIDPCGNVYIAFNTQSTTVPTQIACDGGYLDNSQNSAYNGFTGNYYDQFITQFSNTGELRWASYIGGNGIDIRSGLTLDKSGNLYFCGEWVNNLAVGFNPALYPFTNPGGGAYYVNIHNAGEDGFISKFKKTPLTLTPTITAAGCSCAGSASVAATGGCVTTYKYKWYNSSATLIGTAQSITNVCAGNYKVIVSDTINCSFDSLIVTIAGGGGSIPINSITATAANCNGAATGSASVTVTNASATYTYSWSNGTTGTTTATQFTATNLLAGIYTVTVSDGSCSNTSTVSITAPPSITPGSITLTSASCGQSNGTAVTAIATGGTGTLTYSWSNGNSGLTANNLSAQTYTLTVSDANNCSSTTTVNIGNTGGASISTLTKTDALCNGGTGNATVNITGGASGNYTYSWSNGANTITSATSNQALLTSNNYTVTVIDGSCSVTSVITITEPSAIIPSALQISPASCGFNNGIATASATGGNGVFDYTWTSGATGPTAYNLAAATYTVTVSDGNFCTKTTTVNIGNTSLVINSLTSVNAICNGSTGSATVTITPSTAPYTYSWSNGASTITTATSNQALLSSNTYTVTVTDANNCSSTTSITINNTNSTVNAAVTTNITSNTISEGESIVLSGGGGTSYTWTPNNSLSCATCPVTIANPTATTTYTLIAKDNLGCADTTDITINVKKPCTGEEDVFIANVFSPNNDGKNDVLQIQGNGLTNIYFAIYDRWGNLMFETRDQAQGWDGNVNGNTANAGTYVYYLKATCKKTMQEIILKGNVSLIK